MDVQQARTILVNEFERILELPEVEAEAELQKIFVQIDESVEDSHPILDNLEELVDRETTINPRSEEYGTIQRALKRIQ